MPKEISIPTAFPDFDGLINIRFTPTDGSVGKLVENIDITTERQEIFDSLNDEERRGTAFLRAVRRYIFVKYDIQVSTEAARRYYDALVEASKEVEDFFYPTPVSPDSTTLTPETSTSPPS